MGGFNNSLYQLLTCVYDEGTQLMCSLSLSLRVGAVMCLGVTAGAYILTLFAVSCCPWHSAHGLVKSEFQVLFWTLESQLMPLF